MDFDPDRDPEVLSPEQAQELLESGLTDADLEQVREVFRDISAQIRWGRVIEDFWAGLLDRAECLAWAEGPYSQPGHNGSGVYKDYPWVNVPEEVSVYFEDGSESPEGLKSQHKRHLLQLYLSRKILGGLRTKVRQGIENLPAIPGETEVQLVEQALQSGTPSSPQVRGGVVGSASRPCVDGRRRHVRTRSTRVLEGDLYFLDTYCLDCHQNISRQVIGGRHLSGTAQDERIRCLLGSRKRPTELEEPEPPAEPETCPCNKAKWVEGKEGKEAYCSLCEAPIDNPGRFLWQQAGLEPFGDNPEEDEVITLCSEY